MKVRLTQKSVRFRLTQSEVKALGETGLIQETVPLLPQALQIELRAADRSGATFSGNVLLVGMPAAEVSRWAGSDEVGLRADIDGIQVVVEKDFQCLHPADPAD